ncbi:hypothetical protein KBC75_03645 [Candidatus Shapirobacteria bacterium]|nr:hypothetical protein [Candidatus Shapirobacteria bacterium]
MLRRFPVLFLLLTSYFLHPVSALAVPIDPPNNRGGYFSQTYPSITGLIGSLLKNSLTIAGVLLLCLLIFGGFSFIMSAGQNDPKKTAMAQAMITDAVIGFLVVILAYFIVQIVEVVTGVNILNPTF